MTTYDSYNRDKLIELLNLKNKKIDSQRSMLYQSRVRREKLQAKVKAGYKIVKENARLRMSIEKLNQRIGRLIASGIRKTWSMKEQAPVMINAIMAYNKLKKEGYVADYEMAFLILAHQEEWFFLPDVEKFNKQWGLPVVNWRSDLRACCEAGFFGSAKNGRRRYYFLNYSGRKRLENLLRSMYEIK